MIDNRYGPEEPSWIEPLSRGPLRIKNDTPRAVLARELTERLEAVLASRGLTASPDGWRDLALQLLIEKSPPIPIVTDVDLMKGGKDGSGMKNFIIRTRLKSLMKQHKLSSIDAAAARLAREAGMPSKGRIKNIAHASGAKGGKPSKKATQAEVWPRADRRWPFEQRVLALLNKAAAELESVTN